MSAFKQKLARLGATVGVLAATTTAIMAVGGVTASSAFAECNPKGTAIAGKGSTLQRVAQENWISGFAAECTEGPTVTYTGTGSGDALTAFRYNGAGAINTEFSFVGTDDAPTAAQITNAQNATTGAKSLTIPVSETAIAVIYNPPSGCTPTFGKNNGITWAQLNEAFGGEKIKKWSGFTKAFPTGGTCENEFTRVVRSDGSGTTFQFKNYLATESTVGMPCKLTGWEEPAEKEVKETTLWANMRAVGKTVGEGPNTVWPQKSTCPGEPATLTSVVAKKGGGEVVKYVSENPGTIGYASLPDVKSANNIGGAAKVAWLQNNGPETVTYATPEEAATEESNCGPRQYEVPLGGREGESGESVDWSKVFGAKPAVGKALYPLCTLTYDLSWTSYEKAGYGASSESKKNAVKSYLGYVLGTGQSVKKWYQPLPTGEAKFNVLGAAKLALSKVGK
jgi:ABC-type phosphate transport system substrate-binding protein